MKKSLLVLRVLALGSGRMDSNGNLGTGLKGSGGVASGSINERSDGSHSLVLNVTGGVCTGVYDNPKPGGTELGPLICSGGKGGNATVSYDKSGTPARATYSGVGGC